MELQQLLFNRLRALKRNAHEVVLLFLRPSSLQSLLGANYEDQKSSKWRDTLNENTKLLLYTSNRDLISRTQKTDSASRLSGDVCALYGLNGYFVALEGNLYFIIIILNLHFVLVCEFCFSQQVQQNAGDP